MKVAYLVEKQKIEISEIAEEAICDDGVKVKVGAVGICGSDVYFYEGGYCGPDVLPFPIVLGHECAGTIVEVGKDVKKLKVGDKVSLEPGITCGKCEYCLSGHYNLCPEVDFMAAPPFNRGALQDYVVWPEHLAFKLPDNMDAVDGALVEPLAVGFSAVEQAGAKFGDKVVILGAGCIGLMTVMACKAAGVKDIIVVDLMEKRLEMALSIGASCVLNPKNCDINIEIAREFPEGSNIVFESAGHPMTTKQTGTIVKPGGTIVLVGNTHGDVPFDFFEIMNKEITVKCVFRYKNLYPKVIAAIAKGIVNPKTVVSKLYTYNEVDAAFQDSIHDKQNIVKGVIEF